MIVFLLCFLCLCFCFYVYVFLMFFLLLFFCFILLSFIIVLFFFCFVFLCLFFLFVVLFLVALSDSEKHCFPCISNVLASCWLEGSLFLCILILFIFLVLFVFSLNNKVLYYFMSVLSAFFFFVKRLSGVLVCILWSCFLFVVLFSIFVFCLLSRSCKKAQKTNTARTNKKQKCRKQGQFFQFAQLCSQMLFLFFAVGLKQAFLSQSTVKLVVSAYFEKAKNGQIMSSFLSRKKIQGWVKN